MNKKKIIQISLVALVVFTGLILWWGTKDSFYRFNSGDEVVDYLSKQSNQDFQYLENNKVTDNNSPFYGELLEEWGSEDGKMFVQSFADTGELYEVLIININNDDVKTLAARNAGIELNKVESHGIHQTNDGYYYNIRKGDYNYLLYFMDNDAENRSYFSMELATK